MCCQANWKREAIPDHKFDFVDTAEFHTTDWLTRLRYVFIYVFMLKNLAIYCLDIYTAITMVASSTWTNVIFKKCGDDCKIKIPFHIAKWIFVGCIIFGFLLLVYEAWKARRVIKSRDIAFAYTNVMANDYYSLRSYDTFCFFCQLGNSTKTTDEFAFFVFFTFKDWKRTLLSDGPRQAINACTLYSFAYANDFQTHNLPAYWDNSVSTLLLLLAMIATVVLFACSLLLMIAATLCYIPLVCYIQGNLKEFCCHKVDKRIAELLRHKQRARVRQQLALEKQMGEEGVLKDKKGKVIAAVALPTLPTLDFAEDDEDMRMATQRMGRRKSIARFARSLSQKVKKTPPAPHGVNAAAAEAGVGLPPVQSSALGYPPPRPGYPLHSGFYGSSYGMQDPYGSQVNLAAGAAEFAYSDGPYHYPYGGGVSPAQSSRYSPDDQAYQPQAHNAQSPLQRPHLSPVYGEHATSSSDFYLHVDYPPSMTHQQQGVQNPAGSQTYLLPEAPFIRHTTA
ncbi:hypothetical protein QFC21_004757 [Naganishia friedmannii]|uniref:Uncharacterized protein n=1 Tax=Naganishia friedmannii TaxID=89922 RepID=A0ACC2VE93_9TREE|nr:hypothetical protein QFC21_004757 [Naganishia friedmannii]